MSQTNDLLVNNSNGTQNIIQFIFKEKGFYRYFLHFLYNY